MEEYDDEELLMLSGIQHFAFCPRQWALIHIDQLWNENHLTLEGLFMHERVDNPTEITALRGNVILRSVPLISRRLGFYGLSDAIELSPTEASNNWITHPKYRGHWAVSPIEYKHGAPKSQEIDAVQLCAQAMALEQMWTISIDKGFIYYGKTRHHQEIVCSPALRQKVESLSIEMHKIYKSQCLPTAHYLKHCDNCSLVETCLPHEFEHVSSVEAYIKSYIDA